MDNKSIKSLWAVAIGILAASAIPNPAWAGGIAKSEGTHGQDVQESSQFLPGGHAVLGTIQGISREQIKVDIGEVQPRFLPLKEAKEKEMGSLEPGDTLVVVLNEQNLIVDYHPADHPIEHHRIVRGTIAQNLSIGHDKVVIETGDGSQQSHEIVSQARSKLASIPVGVDSVFLIDESNRVADATFASPSAVKEARESFSHKSPLKGAQRKVDGTVVQPLSQNQIIIRTSDGAEERFEVRPLTQEKLAQLQRGQQVVLMVDPSDQVFDVAVPPQPDRTR
jgi:hypothetical protein